MGHFLITGHTGFKGAWLTELLLAMGHTVSGLSLSPEPRSLFESLRLSERLAFNIQADIRNLEAVEAAFREINPEYLIHFAAQALVSEGYRDPVGTYETNVWGTLNVLKASNAISNLLAQLIVTTDKVYKNTRTISPFREDDPLGGNDPYSSSKAIADSIAQEFLSSGNSFPGSIARAGNVIGIGDYSSSRLLPDINRALAGNHPLEVRNLEGLRPWQHVLDCLGGYLMVLSRTARERRYLGAWNFGPESSEPVLVREIIGMASRSLDREIPVRLVDSEFFQEEKMLFLDASRAKTELGWRTIYSVEKSVQMSLEAETHGLKGLRLSVATQIDDYLDQVDLDIF